MNYDRGTGGTERHEADGSFEFLLGIASARLQEALQKQMRNPDYLTVWLDHFPGRPENFASFTLARGLEHLAEADAEYFDVAISVTATSLDDQKRLASAEIAEGDEACMVFSTKRYDPEYQYVLTPDTAAAVAWANPILQDLDSKLFTYDIVPFRAHEQSA